MARPVWLSRSSAHYCKSCYVSQLFLTSSYPNQRDKLVSSVRRNSYLAYLQAQEALASATASAQAAYATLTDMIIDSWSESQLKEFCDKNGINGKASHMESKAPVQSLTPALQFPRAQSSMNSELLFARTELSSWMTPSPPKPRTPLALLRLRQETSTLRPQTALLSPPKKLSTRQLAPGPRAA